MIVAGLVVEPPAALIEAINKINERILRLVRGRPQHEHDDQHARALFCRPLRDRGGRRVREHFRADRAGRLHRNGRGRRRDWLRSPRSWCEDFAVPRAATPRKADAVLRPDRRDDCYLALSRRLELVVARAAGVSAWQFMAPALASAIVLGVLATVAYNPMSANLRELSKRMETELFGRRPAAESRMHPASGSTR